MLAVIIGDNEYNRIFAKYDAEGPEDTHLNSLEVQTALEKKFMSMIQKQNVSAGGEPGVDGQWMYKFILDDYIGVYRDYKDFYFVVLGRAPDHEESLSEFLKKTHEAWCKLMGQSDRRALELSTLVKNLEDVTEIFVYFFSEHFTDR